MTQDNFCRVCSRGFYSCKWRKPSERKKCSCCWSLFVSLLVLLSLSWIYICLVAYNDRDHVNWKLFRSLKVWVNWFMVLIIIYGVLTSYCVLLLLFALLQVALREQLDLHWLHKIFLCLGLILLFCGVTGFSLMWKQEWPVIALSFQATGPFLQFGAVGALILLSSFVFHAAFKAKKGSKFLIAVVFLVVSAIIFLCPLLIKSPCLMDGELPQKPGFFAHRGAPMSAPENTIMSFEKSMECKVTAFESDVQVSKDGIPFLMHDKNSGFLERTTNVKEIFPKITYNSSSDVTFGELQKLNAGEWFLKTDPFHTVSQLTDEEKEMAKIQTVPSLDQFLNLSKKYHIPMIFDIYSSEENDTNIIVETILNSGIDLSLIYWLPPNKREEVIEKASGFIQFYNDERNISVKDGRRHLNVNYSILSMDRIRELGSQKVTVNLYVVNERWLFSLLWCAGASSVTTNSCHLLSKMEKPDWTMTPSTYRKIWISVDIASILIMIGLYILHLKSCPCCKGDGPQSNMVVMTPLLRQ